MKMKRVLVNIAFYVLAFSMIGTVVFADSTLKLDDTITNTLQEIIEIVLIIGAGACIAKCVHIGIMYVTSTAADKSRAKEALLPWLIGTIVCFGAAWIAPAIINLLSIEGDVLSY